MAAYLDRTEVRLNVQDRTAPDVKRESGVSDAVNTSGGEWNVASAIVSVISPTLLCCAAVLIYH